MTKSATSKRKKGRAKPKKTVINEVSETANVISASIQAFDKAVDFKNRSTHWEFTPSYEVKNIIVNRKLLPYEEAILRQILAGKIDSTNPNHNREKQLNFLKKVLYINPTVKARAENFWSDLYKIFAPRKAKEWDDSATREGLCVCQFAQETAIGTMGFEIG